MDSENIQSLSSLSSSSSSSSCQLSPSSAWQNLNPPLISQVPCISSQKRIKAGRKKFKVTRHPIYRGVRQRNGKNWVSEIREPKNKSRIWLGTYAAPEMAARAYDAAALQIRGTMAVLNFPDSACLVPRARSSSSRDIQEAAFMAAEAFRPGAVSSSSCSSSSTTLLPNKTQDKVLETSKQGENKDQKVLEHLSLEIVSANKSSSDDDDEEVPNQDSTFFFDEEALFNMPGLLNSMAEGLILTPPAIGGGFDCDHDFTCDMDLTLWSD
ncbi:hypothetical protein I3760_13G138900 [Carya illinoinensis]|nr:hypothetical protein I3760_13G138900 [Carya illinoinensis]